MSSTREWSLRSLGLTVSTTNCIGLRTKPYKYRLGLVYDYLIEYPPQNSTEESEPDLKGIENAVAYFVASTFNECDDQDDSPLYAVALVSRHAVFQEGFCAPVEPTNECQVIRGYTEIRLDGANPKLELKAYQAIENALFLNQLEHDRVHFVRAVDVVLEPNQYGDEQSNASIVAISIAILSFALAAIFFTGLWRKNRLTRVKKKKEAEAPGSKKRYLLGSAPRKYYELDEERGNGSGFKIVIMEHLEAPSVTWSDITDSASILSNLSKTTSKLERIQEEDNESNHTEEEWDGTDGGYTGHPHITDALPPEYLYGLSASPRHHVDQWDVDAREEGTEPEGCRYLQDSSEEDDQRTSSDCEFTVAILTCDEHYDTTPETQPFSKPPSTSVNELDTSEDTIATSNETYTSNQQSVAEFGDDSEGEKVQQWLIDLVNELRNAQCRKLLTYPDDE